MTTSLGNAEARAQTASPRTRPGVNPRTEGPVIPVARTRRRRDGGGMTHLTATPDNDLVALIDGAGRRFAVLVGAFALQLVAFVACVVLVSVGVGAVVLVVGLFVLVAGLVVAGWAARLQRLLLGYAGTTLPATRYPLP